jgi:MFS family permease
MCTFQLLTGKFYKFYPAKPLFLASITLFELGSAVCGASPSSKAFIVGRAISGLGSAGMFSGLMVIMFSTIPLQQRPIFQGFFGATFAVGSVVGPLVGGTFTDKLTWRWCFWINLPVGAVTIFIAIFILKMPNQKLDIPAPGLLPKLQQLDPIGNLAFFPGIICLILALQWGGTVYSWKNVRIIVLLVLCGVLCLVFVGIQMWKQENATVPPRIVKQRSIAAALWFGFFNGAGMMVIMYYVPIWFQAIKGVSAVQSGLMLLPMILGSVVGALSSGIVIAKLGYYTPFFIISSIMMSVGAGLLTTFTPTTGHAKWIGYQVLFGLGLGFGTQQPMNVVQTVLDRSDIATGGAVVLFTRFLGSSIFLPVAQNVFLKRLLEKLTNLPDAVIDNGATELRHLATGDDLNTLLSDYNTAILDVFYLNVATSCLTVFGSLLVEWRSLKAAAAEQAGMASKAEGATLTEESA